MPGPEAPKQNQEKVQEYPDAEKAKREIQTAAGNTLELSQKFVDSLLKRGIKQDITALRETRVRFEQGRANKYRNKLSAKDNEFLGKKGEKVKIESVEEWKAVVERLNQVDQKMHALFLLDRLGRNLNDLNNPDNPNNNYMPSTDLFLSLIEGKNANEIRSFAIAFTEVRFNIASDQEEGLLDQDEANRLLELSRTNPKAAKRECEKITKPRIQEKWLEERGLQEAGFIDADEHPR